MSSVAAAAAAVDYDEDFLSQIAVPSPAILLLESFDPNIPPDETVRWNHCR